jgi:hypothetical protein
MAVQSPQCPGLTCSSSECTALPGTAHTKSSVTGSSPCDDTSNINRMGGAVGRGIKRVRHGVSDAPATMCITLSQSPVQIITPFRHECCCKQSVITGKATVAQRPSHLLLECPWSDHAELRQSHSAFEVATGAPARDQNRIPPSSLAPGRSAPAPPALPE